MNTTVKPETPALWKFVPFSLGICLRGVALLGAVAVGFAQTPGPSSSPTPTSDGQTQINTNATELAAAEPTPKISTDESDSLVGPIALYPDPLLIQVLAASTYPLEVVQLKQWLDKNKNLKDKALVEAVAQQNWDPSVQALAAFPTVVDKLANNIQWTTDLGNAFLAQESDVMDSVQDLRAKAQANGALKTNDKQTVGTDATQDGKQAITIESAQRDVVYVPAYNTKIVYRDSGYSDSSGYSSSSDSSGYSGSSDYSGDSGYSDSGYSYVGYAVAAAYGYYWGRYNWRDGYAEVNYKNYYNNRSNQNWNNKINNWSKNANNWSGRQGNNFSQRLTEGSGKWQHDPSHRGNAPYGNSNLTNRFGQANNRLTGSSLANRSSQLAKTSAPTQAARGNLSRSPGGARSGMRAPNAGAANRIGNRMPANSPGGARGGAFSAPKGDFARASSARGAESLRPPDGFRGGAPGGRGGLPDGFRGGPPGGRGGPPGGFRGGPPMGGGGPPMGGGGPPIGGGMPMGAPPPPPPGP